VVDGRRHVVDSSSAFCPDRPSSCPTVDGQDRDDALVWRLAQLDAMIEEPTVDREQPRAPVRDIGARRDRHGFELGVDQQRRDCGHLPGATYCDNPSQSSICRCRLPRPLARSGSRHTVAGSASRNAPRHLQYVCKPICQTLETICKRETAAKPFRRPNQPDEHRNLRAFRSMHRQSR
jgi:hypothetical protein